MNNLEHPDKFVNRHIGPNEEEIVEMLKTIGVDSLDELIDQTVPSQIRLNKKLQLGDPLTEYKFIEYLREIARKNKLFKSYIGMGYNPTITPYVVQRNILENPGWYTQYTPYQAEIAQGRLEALMIFQTAVIDLTGLPIANASLLDEGTAAAEAMSMFHSLRQNKNANTFFVSDECYPQTIDVIRTRAESQGISLKIGSHKKLQLTGDIFGILVQYPSETGEIHEYIELFSAAKEKNIYCIVAADILSLALLIPPGEFGADAAVGSTQRFGVPMGYGGPHAAFFATKDEFKRNLPGRIIGATIDAQGNRAYRMALQTREQHIRREKATSNICTAQVLLAIMAAMYTVYHGPKGIKAVAERVHFLTKFLDDSLRHLGYNQVNRNYFDTLKIKFSDEKKSRINEIKKEAKKQKINFRYIDSNSIGITIGEPANLEDIIEIVNIFAKVAGREIDTRKLKNNAAKTMVDFPSNLKRSSEYLTHQVFNTYHSETEMMRYLKSLENKDLSLTHSMISLGSCTMKLNAAVEMIPVTWPEFASIHPFAPGDQTSGYKQMIQELENYLALITGFDGVSFQPNSGAQGEYTGLMVIREYHKNRGEGYRNVVIIPSSAHGTNPASAVMAGMQLVIANCDEYGNIDLNDLRLKAETYKKNLAALMVTYPSTHGVFEEKIREICEIIHSNGGQVYMDGANMNAQVGLTSPAAIGADICHINLHKTFCIPHGGGGPGMGPIAAAEHLTPFLPKHSVVNLNRPKGITAVSSAPWGSAGILVISYAYIKMMGAEGLTKASQAAILNANYIKSKLEPSFNVVYTGVNGRVAHELIFDMRNFKNTAKIEVEDIAKRMMDYGYHAPTVSFPVHGTLMVEPTESESKRELDRFCDVMISIAQEIKEIEDGKADAVDNVLKNSPHTKEVLITDNWTHSYSREKAAYPIEWTRKNKFWASVGRVNNAFGDRNLVCSCNAVSEYTQETVS